MLKDERFLKIIEIVNESKTIATAEIAEKLDISLATVRRDLNELNKKNKIKKIFGGAKSIQKASYITQEDDITLKNNLNIEDKKIIGKYAASLIKDYDFVYLDAGSSVSAMISYIKAKNALFMTNSFGIAKDLAKLGYKVFVIPGELKLITDSLIGASSIDYISKFNFTKGFFGTNGIHKEIGFTTPDINEASVKSKAIEQSDKAFILADKSKFGKVSQITFSADESVQILTNDNDKILLKNYKETL